MNMGIANLDRKLFRSERTIPAGVIADASDHIYIHIATKRIIEREENAMGKTKKTERIVSLKLIIGSLLSLAMILDATLVGNVFAGSKKASVLSINDVKADPYAYKGTITITGVVAEKSRLKRYRKDPNIFLMVDTSEAKLCKQTGCAYFYLPVRYKGQHPTKWDEVNITGQFAEIGGLLVFAADKVKVLRHLKF